MPLMTQLGFPTLLCHDLQTADDRIVGYRLRQGDAKRCVRPCCPYHSTNERHSS